MTTIQSYKDCSTANLSVLDSQLIARIQTIAPGLLVPFDCLTHVETGAGCHAYLQNCAVKALEKAIKERGIKLKVNSAYRTLAQQGVIFAHFQNQRCNIRAAARPGLSNHNTGLALDIEDAAGWRPYFERFGWDWIGSFDPMHFDYVGIGAKDLRSLSIKAYQQLWNLNNPTKRIAEDGRWGLQTYQTLFQAPVEGFRITSGGISQIAIAHEISVPLSSSLKLGDRGEAVKALQKALNSKGFKVAIDDIFGKQVQEAVKQFQLSFGLVPDGVVGIETKRALKLT